MGQLFSSSNADVCQPCAAYLEETSKEKDKRLRFASSSGHIACVKALVESGADVNSRRFESDDDDVPDSYSSESDTVLICATKTERVKMMRCLIELGADVNQPNKEGEVALQWAAEAGFEERVQLLLDAGAHVNTSGNTSLMSAAGAGKDKCLDILLQGLSAGCIYVGSGDPVRVLRLPHNEYAGYTLKHLLLRHMYNLPLPKLCATLLVDPLSPESAKELTSVLYYTVA